MDICERVCLLFTYGFKTQYITLGNQLNAPQVVWYFPSFFKDALARCRKQIIADLDIAYIIDFLVENKVIDDQAYLHIKSEVGIPL